MSPTPYRLRIRCKHQNIDDGTSTSSSESPLSTPKPKSKSQNWRDKLKAADPAKYAKVKRLNKEYGRLYRLQCSTAAHTLQKRCLRADEKEEAEKWHQRHIRNNAQARKRMNKMNAKKKAAAVIDKTPKKAATRHETQQRREKERLKKQKQRAKMTKQQKEEEKRKNRERYQKKRADTLFKAEKKALEKREQQLREMEEQMLRKELELQEMADDLLTRNEAVEEVIDMRTDAAKRKSLERARKAMPKKRAQFVTTAVDLIQGASPKKAAALSDAGIGATQDNLTDGIMEAVSEVLQAPRQSKVRKRLSESLSVLKKKKLLRKISRRFSVSRKLLAKAKKLEAGRKSCTHTKVELIRQFYEANSSQLPDKKFVSKKTGKPRHIIENTIAKLHARFNEENPSYQVGSSTFYNLRPSNVKTKRQAKFEGCLCEYCENINLKIAAINTIHPGCIKDAYELTNTTMCPKSEDHLYHQASCIARSCKDCGVDKLDVKLASVLEQPSKTVQWKCWEMVVTTCTSGQVEKSVKKRGLVMKSGPVTQLVAELKAEMGPHAEHLFFKDWQHSQEVTLRKKLGAHDVLGVFDFAENYKCVYQREVQSAYYAHDSATVHPIVTYYNCGTCGKSTSESCIMISDDLNHDYHLVNAFQEVVSKHLQTTRGMTIKTFFRYSDGCSSQYKSKGPISDISYGPDDFDYIIHHNYSGTRHGKGASDGESGVVKRLASDAVKAGTAVINNPKSLYDFLSQHAGKDAPADQCCIPFRRSVFYVPFRDVCRDRPDRAIKTVAGTRRLHSIKSVKGGVVKTRNLSCFCDPCLQDVGSCQNDSYVHPWKEVHLGLRQAEASHSDDISAVELGATIQVDGDFPSQSGSSQLAFSCSPSLYQPDHNPPKQSDDRMSIDSTISGAKSLESTPAATDFNQSDEGGPSSSGIAEDLAVGEYVAVRFSQKKRKGSVPATAVVYMAIVLEKENGDFVLKFMRRMVSESSCYYIFPEKEHPFTHPRSDILCAVRAPELRNQRSGNQYVFSEDDINLVKSSVDGTVCLK